MKNNWGTLVREDKGEDHLWIVEPYRGGGRHMRLYKFTKKWNYEWFADHIKEFDTFTKDKKSVENYLWLNDLKANINKPESGPPFKAQTWR